MTAVTDTSISALFEISKSGRAAHVTDAIYSAIEKASKEGASGASMREIKADLQARGMDVDLSTISGRVVELIKSRRVKRKQDKRPCLITSQLIGPLVVVPLHERIGQR